MSLTVTGPVPGMPFRSCLFPKSTLYLDLDPLGYVEEEFFVSGEADSVDGTSTLLAAAQPFTTRYLIRRPIENPSGVVYLEPLHANDEDTPAWSNAWRHITRSRHTWVGVTTSTGSFSFDGRPAAGGLARLMRADPERYAPLHLYDPGVVGQRVVLDEKGFIPPEIGQGMALIDTQGGSILRQMAELLRASARRVYAVGFSQTGGTWMRFLRDGNRGPDGYMIAVAPGAPVVPDDAVVVSFLSESELVGTLGPPNRVADDSDVPRYRAYEVPGTFHFWTAKATRQIDHGTPHNDKPWQLLYHAFLANMERWVDDGIPMPSAPRVERTGEGLARDADGNALGGVRSPWLDVPDGRYLPRCSCSPVIGAFEPFPPEEMTRRYGDQYPQLLRQRAEELAAEGWLLPDDLDAVAPL